MLTFDIFPLSDSAQEKIKGSLSAFILLYIWWLKRLTPELSSKGRKG